MNITLVTFSLSNNGAERVQSELATEWKRLGHNVKIIQLRDKAFGSETFPISDKVELVTLEEKSKNKVLKYWFYLKDLMKYFHNHSEDVLVAFSFTTQVLVAMCRPFIKNKVLFSERNDPANCPYSRITRKLRTLSFYFADICVFQTEAARAYFPKKIRSKGFVIPNPVNPALPERYTGQRRKVIVTASRLRPQKNISLLIEAFDVFHKEHSDYSLEIYGIGEEKEKLSRLIAQLDLSDFVFLCGYSTALYDKIVDCAMYVCSSDYEGISNSLLEALGMGLPTISTDCPVGGARDVICSGENGILVPIRNVEALSLAMSRIAEDPGFAYHLSIQAVKVKGKYSIDKIAQQWIDAMS